MAIAVYFIIDQRSSPKRKRDGVEAPVRIDIKYRVGDKPIHLRFPIGLTGNPKYFSKQSFSAGQPNAEQKNTILTNLKTTAEELYLRGINTGKLPTPETFKAKLLQGLNVSKMEKTIIDHLDAYIAFMKARQASGRIKGKSVIHSIERLKRVLKEIYKDEPFTYDSINKEFETTLLGRLEGFSINTVTTYIKRLKMFLNWATVNNYNRSMIYKTFETVEEAKEVFALSETEVKQIASLNIPSHKNIQHGGTRIIRDWFVISTQTALRYSDLHKIANPELVTVQGGYNLRVKTTKTGAEVVIPVSNLLYNIFKEHDFQIPTPPSNQKYNQGLKRIAELAKLKKPISSHTGRKTFCTIQYQKGTPVHFIMAISGHKTEKEFYRYIGVRGDENAQLVRNLNPEFVIEHETRNLKIAK